MQDAAVYSRGSFGPTSTTRFSILALDSRSNLNDSISKTVHLVSVQYMSAQMSAGHLLIKLLLWASIFSWVTPLVAAVRWVAFGLRPPLFGPTSKIKPESQGHAPARVLDQTENSRRCAGHVPHTVN